LHPVFNVVKLSATLDNLIPGRKPQALLPPIVIDGEYKGNRSRAPGDSSVNYNLWNIVTTYLQEIPQRIR